MDKVIQSDTRVFRLQEAMAKLPQVELETRHHFGLGWYAREMICPAGTLIVGKIHKTEHVFMVTKGAFEMVTEDGTQVVRAPAQFIAKPGTKRAALVLEDAICLNVHCTDKTDLEEIEADLIEPEDLQLFDARNKLKELT